MTEERKARKRAYQKAYNKRRYEDSAKREDIKATSAQLQRHKWHIFIEWMRDTYSSIPCLDCKGTFDFCAMDFDHREGESKLFCVARGANKNKQAVLDEIAKCDLIYSNCHRIRTFNRRKKCQNSLNP